MRPEMQKYVDEVIEGNDENLAELKKLIKEFFKDKTQEELEKIGKKELAMLGKSYDLLMKKEKYTEIDRAHLDFIFNKPMKKYIAESTSKDVSKEELISLFKKIYFYGHKFSREETEGLFNFLGFLLITDPWEEHSMISEDKELEIKINIENSDKLFLNVFIIGNKKYESEINNILSVLK